MPEPVEKQICPSCGASFDAHLETCPFCGFVNETADEKKFYNDLDASQKDLKEMVDIPEEKATKEVRRASRLIAVVLIVLGVLALAIFLLVRAVSPGQYHRDEEADYLWLQENVPVMQARYEEGMSTGDFSALLAFYEEARQEDRPVWRLEHDTFTHLLFLINETVPSDIESAERLREEGGYRYLNHMQLLFYDEMDLAVLNENKTLSEEEKTILTPLAEPFVEDMKTRFAISDEEMKSFLADYAKKGYISYSDSEKFVAERIKER